MNKKMEKTEETKEATLLRTGDVKKLIPQFAIPAIIGFVVVSLYNIIDRVFIGQGVGEMAIAGLALTMPIANIIAAIGTLVGVGASTRLSIVMGKGDYNWARNILAHVPMLTVIMSTIFCTSTLLFMDKLLILFGGSDVIIPYAKEYLNIVIPASVFTNMCFSLCSVLRGMGKPKESMYIMMSGVALNIVLDPIFIFALDMGIKGAAIATAISMFLSAIYAIYHFIGKDKLISFHRKNFRLKGYIVKNIMSIGLAPFIVNTSAGFVALIMNSKLQKYGGDLAIGAFGVINTYLVFLVMILLGLSQGMQPIIGYNYGRNNMKRMKDTFIHGVKIGSVICVIGFLIFQIFPNYLAMAFVGRSSSGMTEIIVRGLRISSLAFPTLAIQVVASQYYQAVSKAKSAIVLSVSRQVVLLIPLVLILPSFVGLDGVWYSMAISDAVATIMAIFFISHERKVLYRKA